MTNIDHQLITLGYSADDLHYFTRAEKLAIIKAAKMARCVHCGDDGDLTTVNGICNNCGQELTDSL